MNIKVKTGFSKARIESFYRFHFTKISKLRYLEIGLTIICIIIAIIGFFPFGNLYIGVIPLVIVCVLLGTRKYRIKKAVQKLFNEASFDSTPYEIRINDEGLIFIRKEEINEYKWNKILYVREIDECLYFYINEDSAIILPKYTLTFIEKDELLNFVKNNTTYKRYRFISYVEKEGTI